MSVFRDLWWYFRQEKRSYMLGVFFLLIVGMLELIPPYVVRLVMDAIKQHTLTTERLLLWLGMMALTGIVLYFLRFVWRLFIFGAAYRLAKLLRRRLLDHWSRMSPQFFHQHRTGDLMAHATNDVQAVQGTAGEGVLTLVDSMVFGGIVVTLMVTAISWKLTLIALLPMPVMAIAVAYYGKWMHERFRIAQAAFSDINDKVQENISGVRVIKSFGREERERDSFALLSQEVTQKNLAVAKIQSLFGPTISLIAGIAFFLAIVFGSRFVIRGEMTIGELTQFTMYLGLLIWPMLAFGFLFNILQRGRASYDRIRTLLAIEEDVKEGEDAIATPASGDIQIHIDSFTYNGAHTPALQGVTLTVKKGETLGIVGRTGSGKSTLFKLLMREADITDGAICIGGFSLNDYQLSALREAFGYVPQDSFLFSTTIRNNIAFANPKASQADVEAAARMACIHEDILTLEKGYETVVGERGMTLSGGQKQRISIARALLMDPEILILDDALSAVDARTEAAILSQLRRMRQGRTTLIAAHRFSGIEHAEQIIVMDEGRIKEHGNHEQLLASQGWYAWMYQQQRLESLIEQGGAQGDHTPFIQVPHSTP
ncbi:ABC transporter transmembrane domain-containing protein [Marininema halotolerans]|uniref:ATP-binding cassette, subfamily B n=1 Tax=Marininema halotolerans TaxID=1155944 RepID=A0A1I6T0M1_9BACL|nr:ABC transporter transmembrane domain-containing protein [Marininema halotolerans]SFS82809.1 ATP-binding cassette, subfamily B [Marininema halotolerans]